MQTLKAPTQTITPDQEPIDIHAPLKGRAGGVTFRVALFSLAVASLFGCCSPVIDYKLTNTFLGAMHMPAGAVAVLLFVLLVANPILKLLARGQGLHRNEVLVIYITCLFSALVPGRGGETFFIPNVLSTFYYATPENKWFASFAPYIKPWITPALNADGTYNKQLVDGFYQSIPANATIPWGAWLVPLLAWSAIILALYTMHGCLGVMLRAQWAGHEALSFPLLRLPLELTEDMESSKGGRGFWNNPLMWSGFGVAFGIELLNGLNLYFPDVPAISLGLDTTKLFTEAPWNQISNPTIRLFPAIIGISYLLTSEVSFSLWFFHLFSKLQLVIAYTIGFPAASLDTPFWTRGWAAGFIGYQQVGAILAYVGLIVWTGKEHWKHIAKRAVGMAAPRDSEKNEALSYPVSFWGFVVSLTFIIGWTIAAGVSWHLAILLWVFYIAISLALTRLVAEAGLLFVQTGWMPIGPLAFLTGAGPGKIVDMTSAMPASIISSSLMLDMRGFLLPSFVQSFKLAFERRIAIKPLVWLIAACILVSFGLSLWTIIHMAYTESGLSLHTWWVTAAGHQQAQHVLGFMKGLETSLAFNWGWVGIGAGATWLMMIGRSRYAWFPFHPIGLLMMVPFAMHQMWTSIFVGWLCKVLITRFGGTSSYRNVTPFFMGLTLGSVVVIVFWVLIDGWQGRTTHALLPK